MKKPKPDLLNGIQFSWSLTPTDEAQKHRQVPVVPRDAGSTSPWEHAARC